MEDPDRLATLMLAGGRLLGPAGPLATGAEVTLQIDGGGLSLLGGEPPTAWQIPFSTIRELRCRAHREVLEIAGWVAGTLVMITFPLGALGDITPEQLDARLAAATGRRDAVTLSSGPPRPRRFRWVLLVIGIVALLGATTLIVAQLLRSHARSSARADRAAAAAMNLRAADLPAGWSADDPATSPLGGFLSTGGSGHQTAAEKQVSAAAIGGYQRCMGISHRDDRIFGAAGVFPPVEVGGLPYGRLQGTALTEAGTVTQRYRSAADVAADKVQISSPRVPTCFAEAIGRMASAAGDPTKATARLPVARQVLHQPLGAYVTGANVIIPIGGLTGSSTAQLGITVLLSGNFEQTLYTLATPGTFSSILRQQLIGTLAARLGGVVGAASA